MEQIDSLVCWIGCYICEFELRANIHQKDSENRVYLEDEDGEKDPRDIIWDLGWAMSTALGFCPEFSGKLINFLSRLSQSELGFLSLESMSLNW